MIAIALPVDIFDLLAIGIGQALDFILIGIFNEVLKDVRLEIAKCYQIEP